MGEDQGFVDHDAYVAWDKHASLWDTFVESGDDVYRSVHGPGLAAACEPVVGLDVLDVGCGQGYFSRLLAERGACITGIDLSDRMIELAVEHEARRPLGISYRTLGAAEANRHWEPSHFDLIVGCMSFHDLPDIPAALRSAHQLLRPTGRLVFSIPHPCTHTSIRAWDHDINGRSLGLRVDRYFDTGTSLRTWDSRGRRWTTPQWRLTMEAWSDLIREAGFLIQSQREPQPTAAQIDAHPRLLGCSRVPYFLIYVLVKDHNRTAW